MIARRDKDVVDVKEQSAVCRLRDRGEKFGLRDRALREAHIGRGISRAGGVEAQFGFRLIPRKETEMLGKKALETSRKIAGRKGKIKVIDVCCGSGNLAIAIAYYNPDCEVYATDISVEALELTLENISLLNLNDRIQVKQGDLLAAFETDEFYQKTDLIVCNPPYILSSKVQKMDQEIASNEPVLAFDGGMLGIKIIQKLISEAPRFLTDEGWLLFEVGAGQGNFIAQLCERTNLYQKIDLVTDDYGNIRVIIVQKSNQIEDQNPDHPQDKV